MIASALLILFLVFIAGGPLFRILGIKPSSRLEQLVFTCGFGLLLTYPAGLLNVVVEGRSGSAIFGYHLTGDVLFLLLIFILTFFIAKKRQTSSVKLPFPLLVLFPLSLSLLLTLYKLNIPDLNIDEYDLGYQAYNLVDGIFAGRKAYVLSFSGHPPLPMFIEHFVMNFLNPNGFDKLEDWMFRFAPALLGIFTVAITWLLAYELTKSKWVALVSASLLAVNNYHLFLSRIFQREAFLTFFIFLSIYSFIRYKNTKERSYLFTSAIFSGAALLTKAVTFIWLSAASITLLPNIKKIFIYMTIALIIFAPVIFYNIGAYLTTGYMDIFFGALFKTKVHPGASPIVNNPSWNFVQILKLFSDQYSLPVALIFLISTILGLRNRSYLPLILYVVIGVILFTLIGLRGYYLSIFTPVFVIFTAIALWKVRFANIIATLIFIYSLMYSGYTLYDHSFVTTKNYTDVYPELSLTRSYSLTTRNFLEDKGWKSIKSQIDQVYSQNHCLSWDKKVTNIPLRRYLGIEDEIKKHYLGPNYPRSYKTCLERKGAKEIHLHYTKNGRISI